MAGLTEAQRFNRDAAERMLVQREAREQAVVDEDYFLWNHFSILLAQAVIRRVRAGCGSLFGCPAEPDCDTHDIIAYAMGELADMRPALEARYAPELHSCDDCGRRHRAEAELVRRCGTCGDSRCADCRDIYGTCHPED